MSFGPLLICASANRLLVRDVASGKQWDSEPLIAYQRDDRKRVTVKALGSDAKGNPAKVVNPFAHPRVVLHEFELAVDLLKTAIRAVVDGFWFRRKPTVVVQLLTSFEGELTDIEVRALTEWAIAAGAGAAVVSRDHTRQMTDATVKSGMFRPYES